MFQNILKGWNLLRFFRLLLAFTMLFYGIKDHNMLMIGFGIFFSINPILGLGCCGVQGCDTSTLTKNKKTKDIESIEYEEIK